MLVATPLLCKLQLQVDVYGGCQWSAFIYELGELDFVFENNLKRISTELLLTHDRPKTPFKVRYDTLNEIVLAMDWVSNTLLLVIK